MRSRLPHYTRAALAATTLFAGAALAQYTPSRPTIPSPTYSWESPNRASTPPYNQPTYQQPSYQQPNYQQPTYQQPTYNQPGYPQPYDGTGVSYGQPAQPPLVPVQTPALIGVPVLTDSQLGDLTASIALYPDPLLAQLLPAAISVEELCYADRWLQQHPGADEYAISRLPLEAPVRALMHYPTVLNVLVSHVDWTRSLGLAFACQRDGLLNSIQRWRLLALTCGHLRSTPEQLVVAQGSLIAILPPPQRQVVYVPVYDPQVVYVRPARPVANVITFRAGGFSLRWLDNDVDWRERQVRVPVRRDWDTRDYGPGRRDDRHDDRRDDRRTDSRDDRRDSIRVGEPAPGQPGPRTGGTVISVPSPRDNSRNSTTVVPGQTLPVPGPIGGPATPAAASEPKQVFVPGQLKPGVSYPQKIVTPQDNKVVNVNPAVMGPEIPGRTPAPAAQPAQPAQPGRTGRGDRGGAPNTSY